MPRIQLTPSTYIDYEDSDLIPPKQLRRNEETFVTLSGINKLSCEHKTATREMGPFGVGLFAKEHIKAGEILVYGGTVSKSINCPADRRYALMATDMDYLIDPGSPNCPAHYMQHLPLKDFNPNAAVENFMLQVCHIEIGEYFLRIFLFTATHNINAGEILGLDYGPQYWDALREDFVLFSKKGELLTRSYSIFLETETRSKFKLTLTYNPFKNSDFAPGYYCHSSSSSTKMIFYFPPDVLEDFNHWYDALQSNSNAKSTFYAPQTETLIPVVTIEVEEKSTLLRTKDTRQPDLPDSIAFKPKNAEGLTMELNDCGPLYRGQAQGYLVLAPEFFNQPAEELLAVFARAKKVQGSLLHFSRPPERPASSLTTFGMFPPDENQRTLKNLINSDEKRRDLFLKQFAPTNYPKLFSLAIQGVHAESDKIVDCLLANFSNNFTVKEEHLSQLCAAIPPALEAEAVHITTQRSLITVALNKHLGRCQPTLA